MTKEELKEAAVCVRYAIECIKCTSKTKVEFRKRLLKLLEER